MRNANSNATHAVMWLAAAIAALCGSRAAAEAQPKEEEHFYVSEQLAHDDNLFRTIDARTVVPVDGATTSADDYVNRVTVGVGDDVRFGRQVLRMKGRLHDVRFQENDHLDHTAGDALLALEWRVLGAWSGAFSAGYDRVLADFANLRTTSKDVVETASYSGSARYQLGPRWALSAQGRRQDTQHSLDVRRPDDFEADIGRFGLDYTTASQHAFGLEYRYIDAAFPNFVPGTTGRRSGEYEENALLARLAYNATIRTRLEAAFGYVERLHPDGSDGEYDGSIWRAQIDWRPREKFSAALTAWRELKAYVDAESDYFIADGVSLTPKWSPLRSIDIALAVSFEEQQYIGASLLPQEAAAQRFDEVLSALATFAYAPRPNLQFQLSYLFSDRASNRQERRYDAQVVGAAIRWRVL